MNGLTELVKGWLQKGIYVPILRWRFGGAPAPKPEDRKTEEDDGHDKEVVRE